MTSASMQQELASTASTSLFDRVGERVRQFMCGLHGHDALLHFERDRLSLVCTSCSYESPGWDIRRVPQEHRHATTPVTRMGLVSKHHTA